jgi:hypothetical protein
MKKSILFTWLAITALCTTGYSQVEDTRTKLSVGVKAGINSSNVYDSQGEEFEADSKVGFVGGVFVAIPIGKFLGLQPEVLFSQRGFRGRGVLLGSNYDLTRTTNYLDIPLLVALKPASQITILGGPQFSYLMKQRDVFKNSTASVDQEQEFKNDNIRKNTLSLLGGIDVNLQPVVLSGRVGWDIQNNNGDGSSSTPRYKNVWLQATLGFRL